MDSAKPPPSSEVRLPGRLDSVVAARRLLHRVARAWGVDERVRSDAALVVSELVANAVLHAGSPVDMSLHHSGQGIRVEVGDDDPHIPSADGRAAADLLTNDSMTGRGLALIDAVSDSWGGVRREVGKVMWAEVGCGTKARRGGRRPTAARERVAASRSQLGRKVRGRRVRLIGVPTALLHASARQLTDLQRELHVMAVEGSGHRPRELAVAVNIGEAWSAVIDSWAALERRLADEGVAAGRATVDFEVDVPDDIEVRIDGAISWLEYSAYRNVRRRLLTLPPSPEVLAYRRWYRDEIISQLKGGAPRHCPVPAPPETGEAQRVRYAEPAGRGRRARSY